MKNETAHILFNTLRRIETGLAAQEPRPAARPRSRRGKKAISGHFDPDVSWQLRKLALDRGTSVQKLLEEALCDLFSKYHLPPA